MKLTWEELEAYKGVVAPDQWRRLVAHLRDGKPVAEIDVGEDGSAICQTSTRKSLGLGALRILKALLGQSVARPPKPRALSSTVSPIQVRKSAGQSGGEGHLVSERARAPMDPRPIVASTATTMPPGAPEGALASALRELFPRGGGESASVRTAEERAAVMPPNADGALATVRCDAEPPRHDWQKCDSVGE